MLFQTAACTSNGEPVEPDQPPIADPIVAVVPSSDPFPVVQDSVVADSNPVSSALEAKVDSLRTELARLSEAMTASPTPPTQDVAGGVSQADTAGTLVPGDLAREAAQGARFFALRAFWALVVLALAYVLVRLIAWVLDAMAERRAAQRLLFKRLIPIFRLAIWSFVIYFIIVGVFQIDQSGLLAAGAAAGVAIGFAAQDILKNIFGGLIIILDKPFQVGDKINVAGTYGEVVSIGLRATRIATPDDNLVSVPNAKVVDGPVANANAGALDCQVVTHLYLPGWVDVSEAKRIAYAAAANSRYVFLDKPIVVNVKDEFQETFLTHLMVKAYVLDTRYEFVFASDVTEAAKTEFLRLKMIVPMWPGRYMPSNEPDKSWQADAR